MAEPERILKTDLHQFANRRRTDGPYQDNLDIDVLIIGAGFGGSYALYEMRKLGYSTVLYDAGTSFGGTWRWNVYPGARVDSPVGETPIYELAIPEVYNTWTWSTNYPGWSELQAYFDHVDKVLNLSKDCAFESVVVSAEFDTNAGKWTIKTADGRTAKTKFLIIAAGFAAKRYIPSFKSMEKFQGILHHSSFWPPEGVDYDGKRVAIVGTGASGVQMIQEMGATAKQLTVFQRTPNLCLPMGKRDLNKEEQLAIKSLYPQILSYREKCFAGFDYDLNERNTFDDSPEEREAMFEGLWKKAGFALWLGGYKDYLFDAKANKEAYNFWRKKQSSRVKNPAKKELLFPEEGPHPFGVKRPCLEQNYYEILDQDNVEIVSTNEKTGSPITEFTETGLKTADGKTYDFDIIGLATGFGTCSISLRFPSPNSS
jgi:cation diffusion facilitator CzcD-associated flavoprotein CzcO